ncbi:hypothetical protein HN51_017273 [Arachis hypogaea]|uniref:Polygalacturonase n=1 Tax=Arachis hypogaea TaxID=3818 RepID=A0A445CWM9_ARAHY|nr:hypothetical protein Ahy_A06g030559 [Arachis hypogaea]
MMKSQIFAIFIVSIVVLPCCLCARISSSSSHASFNSFNVVDYGAHGNSQIDDSKAFLKAWKSVCDASQNAPTLVIPKGKTFMLQPISFQGPCKPTKINIKLEGTVIAPKKLEGWKWSSDDDEKDAWITFSNIRGLVINGGGQFDGQGASWWGCEKCNRPTALRFHGCGNLDLNSLNHINSPRSHISINQCNHSKISNLRISAPKESPNTDGIDISASSNILITGSTITTGDDCIAINGGSSFINVSSIYCGPGHGISIGSLGKNGAYETAQEIRVQNCNFSRTTNGARIKTWKGGSGYAKNIIFDNIIMDAVDIPVIIDQQYKTDDIKVKKVKDDKAVKVSDVTFLKVRGTSTSEDPVQLNCDAIGCTNINLEGIDITSTNGEKTRASCKNVQGICSSCTPNVPCLSSQNNLTTNKFL